MYVTDFRVFDMLLEVLILKCILPYYLGTEFSWIQPNANSVCDECQDLTCMAITGIIYLMWACQFAQDWL